MRANYNTTITGEKCILVPYRQEHVEIYHKWMQDPALQEATASEPLSIQQEYEMQQSWAEDEDKATFIVLDRSRPVTPQIRDVGGAMAGDVNLFFNDLDDRSVAEIEVMIAEPSSRCKGIATEALQMFMAYAVSHLGVTKFCAKIGERNESSLRLFTKLGYQEVSRSAVFSEVTLDLPVQGSTQEQLLAASNSLTLGERFMSCFDDYDEQAAKKAKQQAQAAQEDSSSSFSHTASDATESDGSDGVQYEQAGSRELAEDDKVPSSPQLDAFLSSRSGKGAKAAATKPSKQQLEAQEQQLQQQRLLERRLKKQFMSSKVDKIFSGVDALKAAAATSGSGGNESAEELTPEQFAVMKRDVELLGAAALDKRSAKAYKAAMLSKLGASADKRPRIPAKMGFGMAKKAKQRQEVALQEAIAAGMVKARGRGKKERALKAKQRDKGLMEAGPGFKNGVLRLPKSALR